MSKSKYQAHSCKAMEDFKWSLGNNCSGKFKVGQRVKTRGDMGSYVLFVRKLYNGWYCGCSVRKHIGRIRHFNMNCLEPKP